MSPTEKRSVCVALLDSVCVTLRGIYLVQPSTLIPPSKSSGILSPVACWDLISTSGNAWFKRTCRDQVSTCRGRLDVPMARLCPRHVTVMVKFRRVVAVLWSKVAYYRHSRWDKRCFFHACDPAVLCRQKTQLLSKLNAFLLISLLGVQISRSENF